MVFKGNNGSLKGEGVKTSDVMANVLMFEKRDLIGVTGYGPDERQPLTCFHN